MHLGFRTPSIVVAASLGLLPSLANATPPSRSPSPGDAKGGIAGELYADPLMPTSIPIVDLGVVGDAASADVVSARVASWFQRQNTVVRTTRLADLDSSTVLASTVHEGVEAWVVLTDPKVAHLVFAVQERKGAPPRYLTSDVRLENGLDEMGVERVAQVLYLSATGLWAGNMESSRRDVEHVLQRPPHDCPVVPPASPPSAPALAHHCPSCSRLTIAVGVDYGVRLAGGSEVTQTVGAWIGVYQQRRAFEVGARLRVDALLPATVTASGIELDTEGGALALTLSGARSVARRVAITADLGFAADVIRYRTGSVADTLLAAPGGVDVRPLAVGRAGARFDLDVVRLDVEALVDVSLLRPHYDIFEGNQRTELIVPWVVQPGVSIGVSW